MASLLLTTTITTAFASGSSSGAAVPLTTREALSGIFGSVSLACWIFLLVPQLIENYRNGSAEAISLAFIFVWFLGDIANLAGALWAGLVPVVIAIGIYFCIADGVLIAQCLYYGILNKRREGRALLLDGGGEGGGPSSSTSPSAHRHNRHDHDDDEEEPLLKRTRTDSITIPGSAARRRSSHSMRHRRSSTIAQNDQLAKILEESDESGTRLWFKNAMSVLAIVVVGAAGWALAYESGAWKPSSTSNDTSNENMAPGAQILGYLSAVAYLGARIPQIIKNAREKSCEGTSQVKKRKEKRNIIALMGMPLLISVVVVRSFALVLHLVALGKCHLRRWHPVSFHRERVC